MLKKFLSYFFPVVIYRKQSALSKSLEVAWNNGELVLDSKNTNYSYGSLQRVLRKGLKNIGFDTIRQMRSVLVLGVAGGSVIKTLIDEIAFKGKITGVEIDGEILEMANRYFNLDQLPGVDIVIDDAFEFVLKTKEKYDLMIIDIFQDTSMPNFLFERFFMDRVGFLLNENGYILFNTMTLDEKQNLRNEQYLAEFNSGAYKARKMPRIEQHNELLIIQKIA